MKKLGEAEDIELKQLVKIGLIYQNTKVSQADLFTLIETRMEKYTDSLTWDLACLTAKSFGFENGTN